MSNKTLKAVLVVVAIIAISGSYLFPKVQVNEDYIQSLVQSAGQKLGSVTGPDLLSPYFNVNGVTHEYRSSKLTTATTTPCAFRSPSATSTLVFDSTQIIVASSTATTWTFAKATTPYATTTLLNTFSLSSAVLGTMVGTSTPVATTGAGVDDTRVFAPNTYFVVGLAGMSGSFDSAKLTGICKAEFIVN